MNGVLPFVALLAATLIWLLLPFIPAIRELLRPTDAEPLTMVGQDAGDLAIFADGFRSYLTHQLDVTPGVTERPGEPLPRTVGAFADGTPFVRLNGHPEILGAVAAADRTVEHLVMTSSPSQLPGGETFLSEVYARAPFVGGPGAVYRALLAEHDASLGERSAVSRWLHAERALEVGNRSTLPGRTTANDVARLGLEVSFGRVRAPRIVIGDSARGTTFPSPSAEAARLSGPLARWTAPEAALRMPGHLRITGDLSIPDGALVESSLVVTGVLRVGAGARVVGSIKAHRSIVIAERAVVTGSVISRGNVRTAPGCRIGGPLVAERVASLGTGTIVGDVGRPATVAASVIELEDGCEIHGALSPRERGITVPRSTGSNV
jgi:predicted acyltransferase (DUF342 family)